MPELPDLQIFSANLDKQLSGRKLTAVTLVNTRRAKDKANDFRKSLTGKKLEAVYREGKELRFRFTGNTIVGMHLMLHGKLVRFAKKNKEKYTIIEFLFDEAEGLALTDYQGMAVPRLNPEETGVPDAVSRSFSLKYLKEQLAQKKTAVKAVLLDQKIVRGIGNAYADEILWDAGISPFSVSHAIPAAKVSALHKSIGRILRQAEKQIRKAYPDLIAGEVRDFMQVHRPKHTHTPDGTVILQKSMGGRKTYYTADQELYE